MAGGTHTGESAETSPYVALCACQVGMCACQGKTAQVVVEGCWRPPGSGMAEGAIGAVLPGMDVIRYMAAKAVCRSTRENIIRVAGFARYIFMFPG